MIDFVKSLPNWADIWKMQSKRGKGIKIICHPNLDAMSVEMLGVWPSRRFEEHMHLKTCHFSGRIYHTLGSHLRSERSPALALESLWGEHRGWIPFLNPPKGVSLCLHLGSCEAALSPPGPGMSVLDPNNVPGSLPRMVTLGCSRMALGYKPRLG